MSMDPHATPPAGDDDLPLGQRLYDNWPLLMVAGIAIMAVVYTGWGIVEIFTMPPAQLP